MCCGCCVVGAFSWPRVGWLSSHGVVFAPQSNDAFLANLHACLLQIAREAYMLYHTCCVANPDIPILRLQGGIFNFGGGSFEGVSSTESALARGRRGALTMAARVGGARGKPVDARQPGPVARDGALVHVHVGRPLAWQHHEHRRRRRSAACAPLRVADVYARCHRRRCCGSRNARHCLRRLRCACRGRPRRRRHGAQREPAVQSRNQPRAGKARITDLAGSRRAVGVDAGACGQR